MAITILLILSAKRTMGWIKNNYELINVAVTRAKNRFIFVGDKEAIDALSKNDTNDIKALSDYVFSNGEISVPQSEELLIMIFQMIQKAKESFLKLLNLILIVEDLNLELKETSLKKKLLKM